MKYQKKLNPKNKGGRPKKVFTEAQWKEFENLCAFQCTQTEIINWFDVDDVTLTRLLKERYNKSFSEVFALKRTKGHISLRRLQFQLAEKNVAMAIFLGKNYLDQRDKTEVVQIEIEVPQDVDSLSDEEIDKLFNKLSKK
ncbi:MAG TPA: hypothetical protein VMV32_06995 [Ignavibacteriaceae bacterium]|nr:hypothetical protein [Ignavibacteriaceae bacterium]